MKTKTSIVAALFVAATIAAQAQTSVPTPRSVAPGYTPPVETTAPTQTTYTYVAPHAGTWDFYLMTGGWFFDNNTMNASHINFGHGDYASGKLKMKFDDSWYFGFGAGYNITEQLSVHAQFAYANPDYESTFSGTYDDDGAPLAPRRIYGNAEISTGDIAIRYDLLKGKFRPFVQASIGFIYIDTGIPDGPYSYWWDWYWGDTYVDNPTVDHTYFTLGATAGASYYFTKNFFAQASYTANWANTPHNWMLNQRVNVAVGWNY